LLSGSGISFTAEIMVEPKRLYFLNYVLALPSHQI